MGDASIREAAARAAQAGADEALSLVAKWFAAKLPGLHQMFIDEFLR